MTVSGNDTVTLTGYLEQDENVRYSVKGSRYEEIRLVHAGRNQPIGTAVQTHLGWRAEYVGPGEPLPQTPGDLPLPQAVTELVEHYRREYERLTGRMGEVLEWVRDQRAGEDLRRRKTELNRENRSRGEAGRVGNREPGGA